MPALPIRFQRGGVYLPSLGLWLDPHDPKTGPDRVFVSHAHADHIGLHREVIVSKPTSRLMHARLSGEWAEHILDFGQTAEFEGSEGPYKITLLPAGHIFGSAMSFIESGGSTLLYTGDFKLRPGLSAETCEPRQADILIMETTYGRPVYHFPPTKAVMQGVTRFCREALDNEETPVLLGYSLGKSQELLRGLADASLPLTLHGTVHKLTRIYEQFGHSFPPYSKYESASARGTVLICPPNAVNATMLRNLGPTRLAVLTGWAVDQSCRYRYQAHAAFPLSDHADFPDLVEMVKQVKPRQVYTLHGFAADFAQTLRDLGYQAYALSEDEQLALPLGPEASARAERAPTVAEPARVGGSSGTADSPGPTASAFHAFALVCASISQTARKLEKTALLADYLKGLEEPEVRLASAWFTGHPFPPIEGKALQLGWALIRDVLCGVARLDHAAFGQCYLKHSDLGETAFEILEKAAPATSNLSLSSIDRLFHELHAARGPLSKLPILKKAFEQCTALEGKYLVKILTGDLRIGLKEGLVEEGIALAFQTQLDEVKSANLILGNIGETSLLAKRGQLNKATLAPFRPLKFMLASPEETAADIWARVLAWSGAAASTPAADLPLPIAAPSPAPAVWLEDKYDGIRSQLHKVGDRVALFSRDLKEITTAFLDVADAMRPHRDNFILDGELVAMRAGQILPFAELQKRLGRREGDLFLGQQIPVHFIAFDLLWLNGESWLNRPLHERRAELENLTGGVFDASHVARVRSEAEIEQSFTEARARGNEGLMIKDPASVYAPGRRGLAWLKLKKTYATLDCVVVGAEYGHGKRKAVLSDYTFAVRDESTGELKTIGKAYSGLTDAEIARLTQHFLEKAVQRHGRYLEVVPDTVLEIAFDLVQPSDRHTSGLALRFPRIARIRTDRTIAEIDTVQTAQKLVKETVRGSGKKKSAG